MDNKPDLKDLPKVLRLNMVIHLVETMDEVLKIALTKELPKKPEGREAKVTETERKARAGEEEAPKEPPLTN